MPRRCNDNLSSDDPPKKKNCNNSVMSSVNFKSGEILKDITGKQWKLGKAAGVGGFGEIYLASDTLTTEVRTDCSYVAKIEDHRNGPLFVEMNCYLRIAKHGMVEKWKREKQLSSFGMPYYVASGSHVRKGVKYRFLILPKFEKDLEKILEQKKVFNLKTVLAISLQIIDVLEYIHSKGYIHSDIKASNILLSNEKNLKNCGTTLVKYSISKPIRACRIKAVTRPIRFRRLPRIKYNMDIVDFEKIAPAVDTNFKQPNSNKDQVYLLDYGLASKYLTSNGEHKPFCADERKAHAGTILFCSRDAHKGVPSRRSDLESLGYNMIYWLTGNLPWSDNISDPEIVQKKKQIAMSDIKYFLRKCFIEYPNFLEVYFKYLQNLQFQEQPDYDYCKRLLRQGINVSGFKNDALFDFDNTQIEKLKQTKAKKQNSENLRPHKFIYTISRAPLQSNIPVRPLLRKKVKDKKQNRTKWFKDLTDPEVILKQAREKRNTENITNITDLNIRALNPTSAMIDVYNKCMESVEALPSCKGDSSLENANGYTYAMKSVLQKMKKRKEVESEDKVVNFCNTRSGKIIRRCISKRKKKFESPAKSPPQARTTKSATVLKKEKSSFQGRRSKSSISRRAYSLRG